MASDIDAFLGCYSPEIARLAEQLRNVVKAATPGCSESLHARWKVISYGHRKKFCAIAPHADWVNLQFHNGVSLQDPSGILEGTGKSMRHVKIRSDSTIDAELRQLIGRAAAATK